MAAVSQQMISEIEKDRFTPGGTRELLQLAWPLVLSNSFWTMQVTVDRILLGWSSSDDMAASTAGTWLFWIPVALLQNTAGYATTFVAQYTGAGQPHRVGPAVWQAILFSVITGLAFLGFLPFIDSIIALGGHSPRLQKLETIFCECLCFAALPFVLTAAVSSFFAGRGDSRTVLLINAVGLVVNGVLDYAWIFGHWGFPAMGIAGAGWATVAGTSVSAVLALALMLRARHRAAYDSADWRFNGALCRRLMKFGLPNGLLGALDVLAFTVFFFLVGRLGEVEFAASSIALTLNMISFLPAFGLGQAISVLVGQRLGENRPDLAERTTWTGLWLAFIYMSVVAGIYLLMPDALTRLFESDEDPAKWGQIAPLVPFLLRFIAVYSLFDGVNLVFSFALRGAGDTRFVTTVAVALAWPVMVVPTWAVCAYGWGLTWAWTFVTTYILLLAVVYWLRFRQRRWQSMRVIDMKLTSGAAPSGAPERERP
ncbi:MAG: MATE family efflux transporter [Planctomycetes bacterium]|nr:MATE family efflux transporter [Planctomycetota bacterium]